MPWYAAGDTDDDSETDPASGGERPVERTPRILPMWAVRNAMRVRRHEYVQALNNWMRERLNEAFPGYERL